ncbi:glutamine--tRNA ligase/YqeY domain fusion protein [candidate division TA06 bacterium]|uniref:Glutamine--tRNA ligase n=1 Tax=candidate division TA06 bacterium TaxID=2250710 RepID=A0A933I7J3_UNCT6|nr:glutamine--tRNA ligase/YqeY domain fusion protein [candidate division TA06 bacterium]
MNNTENTKTPIEGAAATNFIREAVAEDLKSGRFARVHTRFPPEPNAYLHIGHAKAIWIDYGIAQEFGGLFNLRFDDTNPAKEEQEFVDAIIEDVKWIGADFGDRLFFASDYFEQMYQWAVDLIKKGKAYVCDLSAEEVTWHRGTLSGPGKNSPGRDRSVEENLDLFQRMRQGEFPDGSRTLRAKIDMAHPNLNMRDPVMYRILNKEHHRQGDKWQIYPMYDWAHCLEDSIEGITHSLCSLEYEDHRPLYDWFLDQLGIYHPRQIEFARLNMNHTVMSKRKLVELVKQGLVDGFDDPRLPTIAGLRRRGYTPQAIKNFCERIGVAKRDSLVDYALLEHYIREELNRTAPRVMAALKPLKVVIENYPAGQSEMIECDNNPEDPAAGKRQVPFGRELYIEQEDFSDNPPKGFFRLSPGQEVRLKHAYYITCREAVKDGAGNMVELRCSYDPQTKGGDSPDGRKVKSTLHWVSAAHAVSGEVRLYQQLFSDPAPTPESPVNLNSLTVLKDCKLEPGLKEAKPGEKYQFLRQGYFCVDSRNSTKDKLVFNRTVGLKDSWSKEQKK